MNSSGRPARQLEEYARYVSSVSLRNSKVACALVIVLMPAGITLDYFVYPDHLAEFFQLRLVCSALTGLVLVGLLQHGLSDLQYRILGMGWYLLPAFFISWMIAVTEGAASPYYAGLSLVILAVSSVIQATFMESIVAVSLILLMYMGASFLHPTFESPAMFFNNSYFLVLTAIIVVTGNFFFNRLRFREFALRYELDENRKMLEESNRKLLELDQVKSRFFANISHELRTPLTLLLGPLESLIHRFGVKFDEETRGTLHTMHANGMRLLKLINDLLELVRLESGRMQLKEERVDLPEFLRALTSAARQVASDKKLRLETTVAPNVGIVAADRDKLEKVLLNLIFNALKFTPPGGRVEVNAERRGEDLLLKVADTGAGISAKNLPLIFGRFWQADDSTRRKFQGAGIGLALVKELVEFQGGEVSVESAENVGTTFTIRLPYRPAPETPAEPEPAAPPEQPGGDQPVSEEWLANLYRRAELFPALSSANEPLHEVKPAAKNGRPSILVADDEPDMLRFLKSHLGSRYHVIEAGDGQQALERAVELLPDLILLDLMMPRKDGMQACAELRENIDTQNIPIVLLTARADEETKLAALSAGASDFLTKPFSVTELHVRIKNLLESYDYQRSLARQKEQLESAIEQLKQTESQLVQSEKLASLGRMSAGIIHEINNPLNFATTGVYTLRQKGKQLPEDQQEEYAEILQDIDEGLARVKKIVIDLRTFTHPDSELADDVELAKVMDSALNFLSGEWKDKVRIEKNVSGTLNVRANENRLLHVFINLLQNSFDTLRRKTFRNETPTLWIHAAVEAGKTVLIVRDNGEGIEARHLSKIFDPFFTTKDVGEGMGLGLSICYRLVQEFGGRIRVRSEPGKFCEFALEFPAKG